MVWPLGLFGLLLVIVAIQAVTARETFAATSPGTLTQLVTSRPVYYLAVQ